ncbi:MAG: hypothetical protein V4753_14185 [Pseudomonadota bacterium]
MKRKSDPRDKRVVNRLRRASSLSDWLISTGLFTLVAQWALGYPGVFEGFDLDDLDRSLLVFGAVNYWFLLEQWQGIILAFALYFWLWSYRAHTLNEMDILEGLYPEGQSPTDWDKVTNKRYVNVLAVGIVVVFVVLAALLHYPSLFALAMLALSCQDIFGNEIMRENLRRVFAEYDCDLPEDDPRCALHLGRQAAARHYWLERPHLLRIAFMMVATVLVLALTVLPGSFPDPLASLGMTPATINVIATLALVVIILTNELVMHRWRAARDEELLSVEIVFDEAQAARAAAAAGAAADPGAQGSAERRDGPEQSV